MPLNKGPRVGLDCILAFNATLSNTITPASFTTVPEVMDLNLSVAHGKIDTPSRASKWKSKVPGMTELSMTFGYNYQGDPGDTIFTTLRTAFLAKTILHFAVMDNVLVSPGPAGAQGLVFPGVIFDFPLDQPLEAAAKVDIGVELTRAKDGAVIIDPVWLIIAPTA